MDKPDDISENWLLISEFLMRISNFRLLLSDFLWFLIPDSWVLVQISRKDGLKADDFGFINEKSELQIFKKSGFLGLRIPKWISRQTS